MCRQCRTEGADLGNLGRTYAELGDGAMAVTLCQQSLAIKREFGDRPGEGEALNYLGYACDVLGDRRFAPSACMRRPSRSCATPAQAAPARALVDLSGPGLPF